MRRLSEAEKSEIWDRFEAIQLSQLHKTRGTSASPGNRGRLKRAST